jgi:hypothetical protein
MKNLAAMISKNKTKAFCYDLYDRRTRVDHHSKLIPSILAAQSLLGNGTNKLCLRF